MFLVHDAVGVDRRAIELRVGIAWLSKDGGLVVDLRNGESGLGEGEEGWVASVGAGDEGHCS